MIYCGKYAAYAHLLPMVTISQKNSMPDCVGDVYFFCSIECDILMLEPPQANGHYKYWITIERKQLGDSNLI